MPSEFVVGLDVGSTKVSVLVGERTEEGEMRIVGAGKTQARGIRKGVIVDIDEAAESVSDAIGEAEKMAGVEISGACVSISGPHIRSFTSRGAIALPANRREIIGEDIEKVVEASRCITLPHERRFVHSIPQDFCVDGHLGIQDPIGMSAMRLEADVHLVTALSMPVENLFKVCKMVDLKIFDLVFDPLATAKAVLTREEMELGCLLIDVGGWITSYALYFAGSVRASGVVPAGGANVTNDMAVGLRISLAAAEQLKREKGVALASLVGGEEIVAVPSVQGQSPHEMSLEILASIIEPRAEEIFAMIKKQAVSDPYYRLLGSGVVLCGGGSSLRGMENVAREVFELPVRIGRTSNLSGFSELVDTAEWTTGVGLLNWSCDALLERRVAGPVARVKWVLDRIRQLTSLF